MSSASAQHQLLQAIVNSLTAAPALADGRVFANRLRPVSAPSGTAVVVRLQNSTGNKPVIHAIDWATTLQIECYARTTAQADPAQAVDDLLQAVWARLSALDPANLSLMDINLQPAIGWDYDDGETPTACAVIRLQAVHRTPTTSLTPWA